MKTLFKLLVFAAIASFLGGCAAVLVGGGAAGGYYVAKDKGKIGQYSSDAVITSKIKAKYLKDLALKSFNVSVSTNHGVVSLVGDLPNKEVYQRAVDVAMDTKGVKAVDARNLTISPHAKPTSAKRSSKKVHSHPRRAS